MKYLLVAMVLLVAFWVWRNGRQQARSGAAPRAPAPPAGLPLPMVSCTECGLHLPRADALEAGGHFYCGPEHRDRAAR